LELAESGAKAGGGALPLLELPSYAVVVRPKDMSVASLAAALRQAPTPVVARVGHDALHLDVAALQSDELELVAEAVAWGVSRASRG
jgi:L-seryl-tRNA(Ser) seleniumtransferase